MTHRSFPIALLAAVAVAYASAPTEAGTVKQPIDVVVKP